MPVDVRAASTALGLLVLVGLVATFRPLPVRRAPSPLPAVGCQAWMADAIPRVGAKKREAVAAAIRRGEIPVAAQGWFSR